MGTPSSTTAITANIFQNNSLLSYSYGAQSSPADVRSTSVSSSYIGASEGGNIYFTSTSGTYGFSIENINASTYNTLSLQFGYKKESSTTHASFSVDYWNGSSWVTITNSASALFNETANASAVWYLSKILSLPVDAQINSLKIRFVKTGTVAIRIDDVKLTGFDETLPTVINNSANSVTSFSATFVGEVTETGGYDIIETGTLFSNTSINSNPLIGGAGVTKLVSTSLNSGLGVFSNDSGAILMPNIQYSYKAYAIQNTSGVGYSDQATFYTLAVTPSAPIINTPSATSLHVAIGNDSNPSSTTYAILETSIGNYVQTDGSLGAIAVYQTSANWDVKTVIGLAPLTTYTFRSIAKNGDGVVTQQSISSSVTTLSSIAPSNNSDIIFNSSSSTSSNENIEYINYQDTTLTNTNSGPNGSVGVMGFYLRDGGAGLNDSDNLPTELTAITFSVTNSSNIRSARLFIGNSPRGVPVSVNGASTISFTNLTNIIANDNSQLAINLRITFNSNVTDNEQMQFKIVSVTANQNGSDFLMTDGGGATSSVNGDINRIEVKADRLEFLQQPPAISYADTNMSPAPKVVAKDSNGNIDFDIIGNVEIISSGILTSLQSETFALGEVVFNSINHALPGSGLYLTASYPEFASIDSDIFEISSSSSNPDVIPTIYSPDGVLENVLDNLGNIYKLSDLLINTDNPNNLAGRGTLFTCSDSIFDLYFESGCGMDDLDDSSQDGRRAVVCKFFEDLSNFITDSNSPLVLSGNKVNIWVRNINNIPNISNNALGLASSFYNLPMSGNRGGIADSEIWKTIHTGIDSYANVAYPLNSTFSDASLNFYHGMIAFKFIGVNWNTDLSAPILPTQRDFYSILLHEMSHALGFESLMNQNGESRLGNSIYRYYTRYDRFLKTNDTNSFLITPTDVNFPMYNYNFNSALNLSVLRPNCELTNNINPNASIDTTLCDDALKYKSSITVPIYTPVCYENGSSFSHFEDQLFPNCNNPYGNNQYFVLSNASLIGITKRFLKPEERTVLCDIGYHTNDTWGTNSTVDGFYNYGIGSGCSGIIVAGVNDGINPDGTFTFAGVANTDIPISGNLFLANDINAVSFEGLQDFHGTGTLNNSYNAMSGNNTTILQYRSSTPGVHLLRYVPIGADGTRGNITYLYVFIFPAPTSCTVDPCNLVINGDFEQGTIPSTLSAITNACGWNKTNLATPDYFHANATVANVSIPCNSQGFEPSNNNEGNAYAGIANRVEVNGYKYFENIYSRLAAPLEANTNYQLSFDVSLAEGNSAFGEKLQAYLSVNPLAVFGVGEVPVANPAMLFTSPSFITTYNGWETITFDFTAEGGERYIYLGALKDLQITNLTAAPQVPGCAYNDGNGPGWVQSRSSYYYLDNVKLIKIDGAALNLPTSICYGNDITDLHSYLTSTPTNGSFIGNGVSESSSGIYLFDSVVAGIGEHIIEYRYINSQNCPITLTNTVTISSCNNDVAITKTVTNSQTIVGQNVTFTLTASNLSPDPAVDVVVTDILPADYTFVSVSPSTGTWLAPNWNIGNLANGVNATLDIVATVNAPSTNSNPYLNTATITSIGTDPDTNNNIAQVSPTVIYAKSDDFSSTTIDGCSDGLSDSVLDNDSINGIFVTPSEVTCSIVNNGGLSGVSIGADGKITVPSGTLAGTYTIVYKICQTALGFTSNCSQTTVTISVGYNTIVAVDDDFSSSPINTLTGGTTTASVLSNDTYNDVTATGSNVIVSFDSVTPVMTPFNPGFNSDGTIVIPIGTTNGTYTIKYRITEIGCPANFTYGFATVVVSDFTIETPIIIPGIRANAIVRCVDNQSDGKIIISGYFTTYNNIYCGKLARLNPDLTLDTSFAVFGLEDIMDMKVIKNIGSPHYNKIIIVGSFTSLNGTPTSKGIARLNADGTVDTTFNTDAESGVSGSNGQARCIYIYPNGTPNAGKILIGGMFTKYNGVDREKMVRLNSDGSIDTSFNPNGEVIEYELERISGFDGSPTSFVTTADGKIIVGGYFSAVNGYITKCIARLFDDGQLDMSFNQLTNNGDNDQPKGFWKDFESDTDITNSWRVEKLALQPDGKVIAAGVFRRYNASDCNNIVRLSGDGAVDTGFNVGTGFNNDVPPNNGLIRDLILDTSSADWKLYVCGDFTVYQGEAVDEVVRLNCTGPFTGSINNLGPNSFNLAGGGPNGYSNGRVWCMNKQGDGKLIIGGDFTTYDTYSALHITRIFPANPSNEAKMLPGYYDSEPEKDLFAGNDVVLYPNPTSGEVFFRMADEAKYRCSVYNLMGQKVRVQENVVNGASVNIDNLPKGAYMFVLSNGAIIVTKTIILK